MLVVAAKLVAQLRGAIWLLVGVSHHLFFQGGALAPLLLPVEYGLAPIPLLPLPPLYLFSSFQAHFPLVFLIFVFSSSVPLGLKFTEL